MWIYILLTALPILFVWTIKNILTSGYPLYPLPLKMEYDWAIPKELFDFMIKSNANNGYYDISATPAVDSWYNRLRSWILLGGITGVINKLTLIFLALMPFTRLVRSKKKYKLVYVALLLNFLALLFTSPQFRYFLHVPICACLVICADVYDTIKPGKIIYKGFVIISCASIGLLFLNLRLSAFTSNKHHQTTGGFKIHQLYLPEQNTKYPNMEFVKLKLGNMQFYSPKENFFFYGTANGTLPCVNTVQIMYFRQRLGLIPQLRDKDLHKGFRSVKRP